MSWRADCNTNSCGLTKAGTDRSQDDSSRRSAVSNTADSGDKYLTVPHVSLTVPANILPFYLLDSPLRLRAGRKTLSYASLSRRDF
jgi:hypothetical protein